MADSNLSVHVELRERSYDIRIGSGCLSDAGQFFSRGQRLSRAVIIADSAVATLYAPAVAESLAASGATVDTVVVAAGEQSKSVAEADRLWRELLRLGADRNTLVVAVGGGVVGDLAGFVAATYARGLPFAQVPTTLLAQVDSAVGGKVGINLPESKNMVGAFWQPVGVLADAQTLKTLADREYRAGLAEVVKYGVILDADFFGRLERDAAAIVARDPAVLAMVIERCCRLKADVVEADEREESGHRAVLNYGHTFGHALEAVTGYKQLLHGEGVSIGMMCAARLAQRLKRVDAQFVARQQALLEKLGLPIAVPQVDLDQVLSIMQHDKKTQGGKLRFVLPSKLGHVEMVANVDAADVRAALRE